MHPRRRHGVVFLKSICSWTQGATQLDRAAVSLGCVHTPALRTGGTYSNIVLVPLLRHGELLFWNCNVASASGLPVGQHLVRAQQ